MILWQHLIEVKLASNLCQNLLKRAVLEETFLLAAETLKKRLVHLL